MNLLDRATQLRMRRVFRRRQKQVEAAATAAEKSIDANFVGRFDRLLKVKRFAFGWLTLALLAILCTVVQTLALSSLYQTVQPSPGGIYNEGLVGTYSNANPLYATGSVDLAVSHLIFAGLLKYDDQNSLVGDLASSYSVDETGKHYVVKLLPNLTWQDGQPLTANDIVFTYHLIQNPDVGSPLLPSWQGIAVAAKDKFTINFDLPNAFSAFPYSLTTGILPQHILGSVPAAQLRSDPFNTTHPVGAGPFAWQAIQVSNNTDPDKVVDLIALKPFAAYAGGTPRLSGFVLHAYGAGTEMVRAFKHRDINAMAGLNDVPKGVAAKDVVVSNFSSTAAVMAFFKTAGGVLADAQVRQALVQGANTKAVLAGLGYNTKPVKEPFLNGQLGYDPAYAQGKYSPSAVNAILDKAGWVRGKNGLRYKDNQPLSFHFYAEDTAENQRTMQALTHSWSALGIQAVPVLQSLTDFQTTLEVHPYDALLYSISIGVDPDVFAYWDSSQADIRSNSRLNFSEYKSAGADASLEAGRTRLDPVLRTVKYKPFLQAWQTDAPALGLYQPRFLYITRGPVYGLTEHTLNTDVDRYNSVASWQIHTAKVTN
ncbi:MAG TPA: ABC transporter substrate-binding protein [Candidatus Saccharimonadales bacterium]|nr:ABC transporter substrate-binding protein [Candidatus Saccharimonadales bacterium]